MITLNPFEAHSRKAHAEAEIASIGEASTAEDSQIIDRAKKTISLARSTYWAWALIVLGSVSGVGAYKQFRTRRNVSADVYSPEMQGIPGAPRKGDYVTVDIIEETMMKHPRNKPLTEEVKPSFESILQAWIKSTKAGSARSQYGTTLIDFLENHGHPYLYLMPNLPKPDDAKYLDHDNKTDFGYASYDMIRGDHDWNKNQRILWFNDHNISAFQFANESYSGPPVLFMAKPEKSEYAGLLGLHCMDALTALSDASTRSKFGAPVIDYSELAGALKPEIEGFAWEAEIVLGGDDTPKSPEQQVLEALRFAAEAHARVFFEKYKVTQSREKFIEAMMYRYARLMILSDHQDKAWAKPHLLKFIAHPELLTATPQ